MNLTKLVLFGSMLLTGSVNAQAKGQAYEYQSVGVEVVSVEPLCPKDAVCIVGGSIVTVKYNVDCNEQVVSQVYKAVESSDFKTLDIYMNTVVKRAVVEPNQAKCLAFSTETKKLTLINQHGDVKLHNLGVRE